ncbi:hypothetical protein TRSC58_07644 [Trypanosoma rangeli SC58]|uniref:Secreted protein n=1 Tax=Trypanosoma rangeli SC58 TaxID=429131 RepID=A0A061ISS2_TRYRA|nr:hypothetical protein TRSC58_07644 [Trypanosoma rangeli SC58]
MMPLFACQASSVIVSTWYSSLLFLVCFSRCVCLCVSVKQQGGNEKQTRAHHNTKKGKKKKRPETRSGGPL